MSTRFKDEVKKLEGQTTKHNHQKFKINLTVEILLYLNFQIFQKFLIIPQYS